MALPSSDARPILVTGAAGDVGAIGRNLTRLLLAKGHKVRALVRREDARAEALRQMGAEVVQGDLTSLDDMHRAIAGVKSLYFSMSISAAYLEASVNVAAVARHHGVEAFVNMSQMSVSSMSLTESSPSPQHRLHWLAEQTLAWSGLPVVNVRPTAFMEAFFDRLSAPGVQMNDELVLPLGKARTSPIAAVDVAKAIAVILDDPVPHLGKIYELTGYESADVEHYARAYSEALGRTITYRPVPVGAWADTLRGFGVPEHLVSHLVVLADWHALGRFDRMTDDFAQLTGERPMRMADYVRLNAASFTKPKAAV